MADSSKTEQATPRQRKNARDRGQITRSREVSGALAMCAVTCVMYLMGREVVPSWARFFRTTLDLAVSDPIEPGGAILFRTAIQTLIWILPILAAALTVSIIAGVAQGGLVFAPQSLAFKFERLSPADRLHQLFSLAGLSSILKSLLPFVAMMWVGIASIKSHWGQIISSSYIDTRGFARMSAGLLLEIVWKSGLILLMWSGVDYALLWWKNEGDLKMSRQDIKDELKQTDGNPENKMRLRRIQRQARRKQMLKAAETATVVVTNPTHYAVALRYEASLPAPIVVAKGLDNLAVRIKEVAWKLDIPLMENKPLAQALYRTVEVGDPIPSALYHSVAEILVMIYKAQAEVKNHEAQRTASLRNKSNERSQ